jgi:hypothetical protein
MKQLTDQEDARAPVALTLEATAVKGAVTLNSDGEPMLPGWVGLTGAITGGAYLIGISAQSNIDCTALEYGTN